MNGAPEAGRKRDLGLDAEADLGAGDLRGVAGDEVVDRMLGVKAGDRGQHPLCVAGKEDDVLGVRLDHGIGHHVGDEIERIGGPRVLGETVVVEVEPARGRGP